MIAGFIVEPADVAAKLCALPAPLSVLALLAVAWMAAQSRGDVAEEWRWCEVLRAAGYLRPHRCMHHRTYPDSESGCMGKPQHYCSTSADHFRRRNSARWVWTIVRPSGGAS